MSMGSCFICGEYCNKLFNQKCHECRRHERFNKSESNQDTRNQQAEPLTKREQFAAMAMQGLIADYGRITDYAKSELIMKEGIEKSIAIQSVGYADALLKALEALEADNA